MREKIPVDGLPAIAARQKRAMQPPMLLVYGVIWLIMINLVGRDHGLDLVVQNKRAALVIDHEYGVGQTQIKILKNHDA